jgi:hypothetical protein
MFPRVAVIALAFSRALAIAQDSTTGSGISSSPLTCASEKKAAKSYFEGRGLRMDDSPHLLGDLAPFYNLFRSGAPLVDGSGKKIRLDRFGIRKYLKDSLNPSRIYTNFDIFGHITFTESREGCDLHLSLAFRADKWSPWIFFAEGSLALMVSNGKLEDEYLKGLQAAR